MPVDVAAYYFHGTDTAEHALRQARKEAQTEGGWIEDVAVIKRHHSGRVSVHSTWAQESSNVSGSAAWGAFTGALIGALAGPGGALAGVFAGGAAGGLIGKGIDVSVQDPVLEELAGRLNDGTSALVLMGDVEPFITTFKAYDGTALRTSIDDAVAEKIREAAAR